MKETDKSFYYSYSSNNIQLSTFRTTASIKKGKESIVDP